MSLLLADSYPRLLWLLLGAWGAATLAVVPALRRRAGTAGLAAALAMGALGLGLRLAAPHAHRVHYDEFEHLDAARNLADSGRWGATVIGGLPTRTALTPPTWPGLHHAQLAALWSLVGGGEDAAFALSALLSAGAGALLALAAACAAGPRAGLLAGAFWAALAMSWRWAGATDLSSVSVFWCAAALSGLSLAREDGSPATRAWAALALALALNARFENALLLVLFWTCWRGPRTALVLASAAVLPPVALALINARSALPGFDAGPAAALANIARQLPLDLRYLAALPGALVLGAGLLGARRRELPWLALSAALLAVYCAFYRGEFARGAEERYALSVLLPLCLAAGTGWDALLPRSTASTLAPAALFLGFNLVAPAVPPDPAHARREALLRRGGALLPPSAYVLTFTPPAVRVAAGRPAASIPAALEDWDAFEAMRAADRADEALAVWKDWGWRSRPEQATLLEARLRQSRVPRVIASDGEDGLVLWSPR